jgi:hypothetical protein
MTNDPVFISYQSNDFVSANALHYKLKESDFQVWFDDRSLMAGEKYRQAIESALRNCWAVVVLISPDSKTSEYVIYEWSFALGIGKPIIPVLLRKTEIHPVLEQFSYIDCTTPRNDFGSVVERLKQLHPPVEPQGEATPQVITQEPSSHTENEVLFSILKRLYDYSSKTVTAAQILMSLTREKQLTALQGETLLKLDRNLNNDPTKR